MSTAVYKDLFDAGVGEEFEGVFDERGVGVGQQALRGVRTAANGVCGATDSWSLECEGIEACLEGICEDLEI